jgi:dienelactone hydrolase
MKETWLLTQIVDAGGPVRVSLVISILLLIGFASIARADQSAVQEIGSDELLSWEGPTNPNILPPRRINEHVFRVQINDYGTRLIVTLLYPDGPGPFPLAVLNHGAAGIGNNPAKQARWRGAFASYYFLSRGYAVLLPMLRGYAGSEGRIHDEGCDFAEVARGNAQDINAVINAMATQPEIDASRIVVAGQSFGGLNTLGFGTLNRAGVVGLVNFNGGLITSRCDHSEHALVDTAGKLGAATHVPSIWLYGTTDHLFRTDLWHDVYNAYVTAGGQAELVNIGYFFTDSHEFLGYPEALPTWVPRVDAFLQRIGMPHNAVFPDYLPSAWPSKSGYAALDDVDKVPYLNDALRDQYRKFLDRKFPRAVAISPTGDLAAASGGFDPVATVLKVCGTKFKRSCNVYAIDDDVVWHPFPDPPPPSHYAALTDANALPYLGPAKLKFYTQFLSRPSPRALVISPDGKAFGVYGKQAFEQALANCQAHSTHCEPYIVNDDVVWSPHLDATGPSNHVHG